MFFVLKVSEVPTRESLREYMEGVDVPKGVTSCEAFGIVDRSSAGWQLVLLRGNLSDDYLFRGRASVLSALLRLDVVQRFSRITFVVQESDFEDFSAVADVRSICGLYCVFANALLQ